MDNDEPPRRLHLLGVEYAQADMDKQRPFSRAYRSFYSAGREEGGIVVHLGSGATATAEEALKGGGGSAGGGAGDVEERTGGAPDDVFEGTTTTCCTIMLCAFCVCCVGECPLVDRLTETKRGRLVGAADRRVRAVQKDAVGWRGSSSYA